MNKDFIEDNNLGKILKNYLKQENLTIDTLSKESKIKIETIKKILENEYTTDRDKFIYSKLSGVRKIKSRR